MIAAGIHDSLTAGFTIITLTKGNTFPAVTPDIQIYLQNSNFLEKCETATSSIFIELVWFFLTLVFTNRHLTFDDFLY